MQELTLDSSPDCWCTAEDLPSLAYLTRLRRLSLLEQVVYGFQVRT